MIAFNVAVFLTFLMDTTPPAPFRGGKFSTEV